MVAGRNAPTQDTTHTKSAVRRTGRHKTAARPASLWTAVASLVRGAGRRAPPDDDRAERPEALLRREVQDALAALPGHRELTHTHAPAEVAAAGPLGAALAQGLDRERDVLVFGLCLRDEDDILDTAHALESRGLEARVDLGSMVLVVRRSAPGTAAAVPAAGPGRRAWRDARARADREAREAFRRAALAASTPESPEAPALEARQALAERVRIAFHGSPLAEAMTEYVLERVGHWRQALGLAAGAGIEVLCERACLPDGRLQGQAVFAFGASPPGKRLALSALAELLHIEVDCELQAAPSAERQLAPPRATVTPVWSLLPADPRPLDAEAGLAPWVGSDMPVRSARLRLIADLPGGGT